MLADRRGAGGDGIQIPYAAVLYDPDGKTWTFVKIGDRAVPSARPITVDHIDG